MKILLAIPLCLVLTTATQAQTQRVEARICQDLGQLVYLHGIENPTRQERRTLASAKREALQADAGRPAIPAARLKDAMGWGITANGAHGSSNESREGAILGALLY